MPAVADVLNVMPPPEDITIAKDEAARIRDTILALKEPYHQVAVLFFLEEKAWTRSPRRCGGRPKQYIRRSTAPSNCCRTP